MLKFSNFVISLYRNTYLYCDVLEAGQRDRFCSSAHSTRFWEIETQWFYHLLSDANVT